MLVVRTSPISHRGTASNPESETGIPRAASPCNHEIGSHVTGLNRNIYICVCVDCSYAFHVEGKLPTLFNIAKVCAASRRTNTITV